MRRAIRFLAGLAAVLVIAVMGAAAWLAFSPSATRWLVRELVERSEGRLAVAAVEGSLAQGISIEGVVYSQDGLRLNIDRMQVAWSWAALLNRQVKFRSLALGQVDAWLAPGKDDAQFPTDLRVPVGVVIEAGRVERLAVVSGERRNVVEAVEFRVSSNAARHTLDLRAARLVQGRIAGQLEVSASAPFALKAQMAFSPEDQERVPAFNLVLAGSLQEIHANYRVQAPWLVVSGDAEVAPFAPAVLKRLSANAETVQLHRVFADVPQAELRGSLAMRQLTADRLEGEVRLQNRDPGEIGERKLPLAELSARFSGPIDALEVAALELKLPRGPALTGDAKLDSGTLDLLLNARDLDLKILDKRLVATRLNGSFRVRASPQTQSLDARLSQADYRIEIDASRRDDTLTVSRASAAARGGTLTLSGQASLAQPYEFRAKGRLQRFDPAAFLEAPHARIDADISAQGRLAPAWSVRLAARANGTGPRGVAFAAETTASVRQQRISGLQGRLTVGRNELIVSGDYGEAADVLAFDAKLRALNELDGRFGGAADAKGRISGDVTRPEIRIEARGTRLTGPGKLRLGSITLRAEIPNDWNKALDVEANVGDLQVDAVSIGKAVAVVRGTPRAHTADVSVQGKDIDAALQLTGGLTALRAWQGSITRFDAQRPVKASILAPTKLVLTPQRIELAAFALSALDSRISFDHIRWTPGVFNSRGQFAQLRLEPLLRGKTTRMRSTLVLAGDWAIEEQGGMLNASINLSREGGDIVLTGDTELPLSLSALRAQVSVERNRVQATGHASSAQLGEVRVSAATELSRSGSFWVIDPNASLDLDARGEFPSIAWVGPLIHPGLAVSGRLSLRANARGTVGAPRMEGTIEGKSLTLRVPANGVALVDGELRATLKDDRLVVHGLRFKGGDGFVTVQGEVGAGKGTTAKLQLNAKRLTLLNRRDAQLELDAAADVVTSEGAIHIQGGAQVVRAHFELLRSASMPTLADDIRIKNAAPAPASRQPLRLSVDLTTDFGDRFEVEASNFGPGSGSALKQLSGDFKARIEGRIHTRSDAKQIPQTTGNLNVVDGSYTAFGRNFRVQRGNLKFSGPLANPALDLFVAPVHGRIHLAPEVGISVTGTARAPRVRLVSQPEMPETEKLSWLLFGRGGQSMDYSVGSATSQVSNPVTEFGWQLSQNLYVAYEQSATGTSNVVRIYNQLTDRIAVQAGAGDASSLYLLYTFTFE